MCCETKTREAERRGQGYTIPTYRDSPVLPHLIEFAREACPAILAALLGRPVAEPQSVDGHEGGRAHPVRATASCAVEGPPHNTQVCRRGKRCKLPRIVPGGKLRRQRTVEAERLE